MTAEEKHRVFALIGVTLLDIQSTEKAIKMCLKIAIPDINKLLTDLTERIGDTSYDSNTLGQLLSKLRNRAIFQDDYEELLQSFLENRNTFAHHLSSVHGWNLETREGCKAATVFLAKLIKDSKNVRAVSLGIINSWRVQSGHDVSDEQMLKYKLPDSLQKPLVKIMYPKRQK